MTDALRLDRARRCLLHDDRLFDPAERRWSKTADMTGEAVGIRAVGAATTRGTSLYRAATGIS